MKSNPSNDPSPLFYALGGAAAVPVLVLLLLLFSVLIVFLWPVLPFVLYYGRHKELLAEKAKVETCDKPEPVEVKGKLYGFDENSLPPLPWIPSNQYGMLRYILASDNTIVLHCSHLPYDLVKAMCKAANEHLLTKN